MPVSCVECFLLQIQFFFCQALQNVQSRLCRSTYCVDEDVVHSLPSCHGLADLMDGRLLHNLIYHVGQHALGRNINLFYPQCECLRLLLAGGAIADNSVAIDFWPRNFTEIWTAVQSLVIETPVPSASIVTAVAVPSCICQWPLQTSDDAGAGDVLVLDGSKLPTTRHFVYQL